MTRRLRSYRKGDQSEDLAQYLLGQFSAVTAVDRQNDFGVDKICALTRYEGRYVFVGSTFGVQVKSKGHRPITFGGIDKKSGKWREWDIKWLFGQDYPLFIAVIDRRARHISVYATARMWWVAWMRGEPFEVTLEPTMDLEDRPIDERFRREEEVSDWGDRHRWWVPLGKPIVDASQEQLEDETFQTHAQAVMNKWIDLDRNNIFNWKLGVPFHAEFMKWEPNVPPSDSPKEFTYAHPALNANVPAILQALRPGLRGLAFGFILQKQEVRLALLRPIVELIRDHGYQDEKLFGMVGVKSPA